MSEFTPITTQEDLDKIIQGRLARETAKYADYDQLKADAEKYKDYEDIKSQLSKASKDLTDLQGKYADLDKTSKEKDTKIASYEAEALRTKVAVSKKLPMELRDFLQGRTEEELTKSADILLKFGGQAKGGDPSAQLEPDPAKNAEEAEKRKLLKAIRKES